MRRHFFNQFKQAYLIVVPLLVTGWLLARGYQAKPAAPSAPISLEIDAGANVGRLPYLFRAGMFTYSVSDVPPQYVQHAFFSQLKPGVMEIDIGNFILKPSTGPNDIDTQLTKTDAFIREVVRYGGEPVIAINLVPDWLTSNPQGLNLYHSRVDLNFPNEFPPKDYEAWARLVGTIVRHYKTNLGLDLRYKIWWEPDLESWQGTEDEYFLLYKYAVLGARRVDPNARIGGPSISNVLGVSWRKKDSGPMLRNFIEYCSRTPLPELKLRRLPLDFVVWHQFNADPFWVYASSAKQVAAWLTNSGYSATTEFLIGEWSSWQEQNAQQLSSERDQPYLASYVVSSIIAMDEAGIKRHAFTSLLEQRTKEDTEFSGGFGIFTKGLIIKPVFNAFKALSMLGENRLSVKATDPFIRAVATTDANTITLVVSNYVPLPEMVKHRVSDRLRTRGFPADVVARYASGRTAEGILDGTIKVEAANFPPDMRREVQAAVDEYKILSQLASTRKTETVPVILKFEKIPFAGSFSYESYLIDSTHANSFAVKNYVDRLVKEAHTPDGFGRYLRGVPQGTYTQADVVPIESVLKNPSQKDRIAASLSRAQLSRSLALLQTVEARVADEVNRMPEISLTNIGSKQVDSGTAFSTTVNLEPYAVGVVVLRKNVQK